MNTLAEEDVFEILQRNNCVFFVGAAISIKKPSNLPNAYCWKRFVFEALCNDFENLNELSKKYFPNKWNESMDKLAQDMYELMPEVVFQIIQDIIGDYTINSLGFFDIRKPNSNHKFLAKMLEYNSKLYRESAIVITTNFDHLLEDAMREIGLKENVDFVIHRNEDSFDMVNNKINVFKLHGSIDDKESIKATLRSIGLRLPDNKSHALKNIIENFPVFFVGYSGYDLDIYPVIMDSACKDLYWLLKPESKTKTQSNEIIQKFNAKIIKADLNVIFENIGRKFSFWNGKDKDGENNLNDDFIKDYLKKWCDKIDQCERFHIIGNVMRHIGELEDATELLLNAVDLSKNMAHEKRVQLYNDLGGVYTDRNDWDKALESYEMALTISEDNNYKLDIGITKSNLGLLYYKQDQWNRSVNIYEESLTLLEKYGGEREERIILSTKIGLGLTYYKQKLANKAIGILEPVVEKVLSVQDIENLIEARRILGLAYYWRDLPGDLDKALDQQNKALELERKIGDTWGIAQSLNNLAIIYKKQGKLDEAIKCHIDNLENRERLGDVRGKGQTYYNLGRIYPDKAIGSYKNALESYKKAGSPPQDVLAAYERLGKLYLVENNFKDAINYLEQSKQKREELMKSNKEDSHWLANVIGELGNIFLLNGDTAKALSYYRSVLAIYTRMSKDELNRFKESPPVRYDNAMRHLNVALGIFGEMKDEENTKTFSDIIQKIKELKPA